MLLPYFIVTQEGSEVPRDLGIVRLVSHKAPSRSAPSRLPKSVNSGRTCTRSHPLTALEQGAVRALSSL